MNWFDRAVAYFSPQRGAERARSRAALAAWSDYEGADKTHRRKHTRRNPSGNDLIAKAGAPMRAQARQLERNHDLVDGTIGTLVKNTVGPKGISIEPQPRDLDGNFLPDLASELLEIYRNWSLKPEVTWQFTWPMAQQMLASSLYRDGEVFAQEVSGKVNGLDHGTTLPYSLELLESDFCPLDYNDEIENVRQGVKLNAWGRPTGYYVYKQHPAERIRLTTKADVKFIPADRMLHAKMVKRLHQVRGVTMFASVISRVIDIKEYEDAERVAAKIAAKLAVLLTRSDEINPEFLPKNEDGSVDVTPKFAIEDGTMFTSLPPGADVEVMDNKRPNPNVETFRSGQIKMYATGTRVGYSETAKDYNTTFAAQKQEQVQQWGNYEILTAQFVGQVVGPVWRSVVRIAVLSGLVKLPANVDMATLDDALFIGPAMPWADQLKDWQANRVAVRMGGKTLTQIARERGTSVDEVMRQMAREQQLADKYGITLDSNPANDHPDGDQETDDTDDHDGDEDDDDGEGNAQTQRQAA